MTSGEIWLRVVIYETRGSDYDRSLEILNSKINEFTRVLEELPGFSAAYWGHNPDDGTIAAVSHWTSGQAIQEADAELKKLQAAGVEHDIHVVRVQNLHLFPVPAAVSMWSFDEQDAAAQAKHRFRLHR